MKKIIETLNNTISTIITDAFDGISSDTFADNIVPTLRDLIISIKMEARRNEMYIAWLEHDKLEVANNHKDEIESMHLRHIKKVNDVDNELSRVTHKLTQVTSSNAKLKRDIIERDEVISELNDTNTELNIDYTLQSKFTKELNNKLKVAIEDKNAVIKDTDKRIDRFKAAYVNKCNELSNANKVIDDLKGELDVATNLLNKASSRFSSIIDTAKGYEADAESTLDCIK